MATPERHEEPHHPIGTLVFIGLYGLVFVVGWLLMYWLVFVPRGRVTP